MQGKYAVLASCEIGSAAYDISPTADLSAR